jgi:hypothetical protein
VTYALACVLLLWTAAAASAEPSVTIRVNGPAANRVGVTILGDGYTEAEQGKYAADVETLVNAFFNQSPYLEYANYFNVYRVDVVSNESGSDHPERNVLRDTALGSSYSCGANIRSLCVNTSLVNAVLSRSVPIEARDLVMVLVNDPEYGGSGGSVLVASTHLSVVELALHESGHTFGRLADEYDTTPPVCNNSIEPAEVNVALDIGFQRIKWAHWLAASTPLPTPGSQLGLVGAYQGAKYCVIGLYRPTFDSKMRSLNRPFESINSEQIVRRIYNFVSPIDSVSPSSTSLAPAPGAIVDFSVSTPTLAVPPLRVRWSINGTSAGEGRTLRLNTSTLPAGTHIVQVEVVDQTPLVRSDPTGLLAARHSWTVATTPGSPDPLRQALEDLLRQWRNR